MAAFEDYNAFVSRRAESDIALMLILQRSPSAKNFL